MKLFVFCAILLVSLFSFAVSANTNLRAIDLDIHILNMTRAPERADANWRIAVLDENGNIVAGVSRPGSNWNILNEIVPATASDFTMLHEGNFTIIVTAQTTDGQFIDGYATAHEIATFIGGRQIVSGNLKLVTDIDAFMALQYGFVYFGRPTCAGCRPFIETLYDLALQTQTIVHYFNTDMWAGHPQRDTVLARFDVATVPALLYLNEGKIQRVNVSGEEWTDNFIRVATGCRARAMRFAIGSATVTHNGVSNTLEAAPFIANGRTMIPLRVVATALGATDIFMHDNIVSFNLAGQTHSMRIGTPLPNNMGTPMIVQNRTFVPLIYVIHVLGVQHYWDATNRAVYIFID